jgi:hypothetical protein
LVDQITLDIRFGGEDNVGYPTWRIRYRRISAQADQIKEDIRPGGSDKGGYPARRIR